MRVSRFNEMVAHEFGSAQGRILVRDTVLGELGHRTAEQALAEGAEPKDVWFALCRAQEVPEHRQWGPDREPRR
ncbi:DUF3046 domain-containing protein [Kocuria palustris]|uniref:DUF3046 domain-containing protein n=1 Tax=Kocuria palustris TaxID=71999 RepID=UPI00119D4C17|nr:DUF3046 domain-containing protein [Kocuria palustris]